MSIVDIISDNSKKNLETIPEEILDMYNLKMLYLEGNLIESLPDDFFDKLSKLTWLDLRRNKLKAIPAGIAHHAFLETLLLQDNEIEALPNEIGLIPNLKVLQLLGNPLTYPPQEIIDEGVQSICYFLKEQHDKLNAEKYENALLEEEEEETSPVEAKSSTRLSKDEEKVSVRELLQRSAKKRRGYGLIMPVIDVKSLQKITSDEEEDVKPRKSNALTLKSCSSRRYHKITRSCSKISLRSQSQWNTIKKKPNDELIKNGDMKEIWLNRLKDLLTDQEKILQQEKNLQALSKWRLEKKAEPTRSSTHEALEVPYGIDPECNNILSRKDLAFDGRIKKSRANAKKCASRKVDVQKLINQVVEQMKNMETQLNETQSSNIQQEIAAKQIESIVELHKKIVDLQTTNATNL